MENVFNTAGRFEDEKYRASFWKRVNKSGACWTWTGGKYPSGYGVLMWHVGGKRRTLSAHRVSYYLTKGPLLDGQIVRHECDNPSCVNPEHLIAGTYYDNTQDMMRRKRNRGGYVGKFGYHHPHAKLDLDEAQQIRDLWDQVVEERARYKDIVTKFKDLSCSMGIHPASAREIGNGKKYRTPGFGEVHNVTRRGRTH